MIYCRPTIQFSEDETVSCRSVTNEVHFFDPQDFSKGIVDRLRLPGIQVAQLATSPSTHVAAYVPEMKVSLSLSLSLSLPIVYLLHYSLWISLSLFLNVNFCLSHFYSWRIHHYIILRLWIHRFHWLHGICLKVDCAIAFSLIF